MKGLDKVWEGIFLCFLWANKSQLNYVYSAIHLHVYQPEAQYMFVFF